ncbi:TPA: hypothetical protein DDZ86_03945 [Candidatus Dependentiae bacterium]|nr:MAG: hypothetical protein UW09_C0003G0143 [candidate division TM6 bacterium GW2011_GWF2_43_87]HBL98769.1 hypothetical protein [Candidatus Dependentiae bacterium]
MCVGLRGIIVEGIAPQGVALSRLTGFCLLVVLLLTTTTFYGQSKPWTACYKRTFIDKSLSNGERAFVKENVMPFTQLIFSWNAVRPKQGFFRFLVRVHEVNGQWMSSWHKMFEWGADGVQRSFSSSSKGSSYCHVRLELMGGRKANGFWIKIEPVGGAQLSDIKLCAACVSCLADFKLESQLQRYSALESVYIPGVPIWSQMTLHHPRAPVLCSPTSTCMLTSFINHKNLDPVLFANGVFDEGLKVFGSWQCNTAHAFEWAGGAFFFHVQRLQSFRALYQSLQEGLPVVVSVRGEIEGAPKAYFRGHLVLIVGFDAKTGEVICHDPASWSISGVLRRYGLSGFLTAMANSRNLAYIVTPRK